jgi:glutamyl-tRNA reductase
MAQLVAQYLRDSNAKSFVVTTRSSTNAKALADACAGRAVDYHQLDEELIHADIVITATSCPMPILTIERIRAAQKLRRGKLLFLIDLAVPRNVDPAAAQLENVYVYDIDALGRIVAENQQQRNSQLTQCEAILDEEVGAFEAWLDSIKLNPLIEQMYHDARDLREMELRRLFRACPEFSDEQKRAVTQLVDRLVNKFMHPCVSTLRRQGASTMLAGELHAAADKARAHNEH